MRINHRIRVSPIRLIGPDGEQIGILPTGEALDRARELALDLVEISPTARPPVCRIMDFGKYKYELSKKDKIAKKKQHTFQVKEMRYRPKIDDHDFNFKTKHVREFLQEGSKVRVYVMFRGREMAHIDFGRKVIDQVLKDLSDIAIVESAPNMEGHNMNAILAPRPDILKKLHAQKVSHAAKEAPKERPHEAQDEPADQNLSE